MSMIADGKINPSKGRLVTGLCLLILGLAANIFIALGDDQPKNTNDKTDAVAVPNNPLDLLGSWIWTTNTFDGQSCQFWRAFDIPADQQVVSARLLLTADNEFTFFLDGRQLGHGAEWRELFDYNLALLMSPGRHVLAVYTMNPSGFAGMLFCMRINFAQRSD